MKTSDQSPENQDIPVLVRLQNTAYEQAKRWSAAVIGLQTALFVGGVIAIFWESWSLSYPWLAFILAVTGLHMSLRAASLKGRAESLKRQHEFLDGLACQPSERTVANLRAELPDELQPEIQRLLTEGVTYASKEPTGLKRVLENVCESAFFSHHLARKCAGYLFALLVITGVVAVATLLFMLGNLQESRQAVVAARAVAATLAFLISVGTIRSWRGYVSFGARADQTYSDAAKHLASGALDAGETHRILSEYQIARAGAPLIASWVWVRHREALNTIWKERAKN